MAYVKQSVEEVSGDYHFWLDMPALKEKLSPKDISDIVSEVNGIVDEVGQEAYIVFPRKGKAKVCNEKGFVYELINFFKEKSFDEMAAFHIKKDGEFYNVAPLVIALS